MQEKVTWLLFLMNSCSKLRSKVFVYLLTYCKLLLDLPFLGFLDRYHKLVLMWRIFRYCVFCMSLIYGYPLPCSTLHSCRNQPIDLWFKSNYYFLYDSSVGLMQLSKSVRLSMLLFLVGVDIFLNMCQIIYFLTPMKWMQPLFRRPTCFRVL